MLPVYPSARTDDAGSRLRAALAPFAEASTMHVGAAAAAASLRGQLTRLGLVSEADFDRCFAIARLTPGTNLLALYTLLGSHIASWRGAVAALAIGTVLPALIATTLAAVYLHYSDEPLVVRAMSGARAGALAVFLWAVVRLSRPVVKAQTGRATALLVATLVVALTGYVRPLPLLLIAGLAGAAWLRPR